MRAIYKIFISLIVLLFFISCEKTVYQGLIEPEEIQNGKIFIESDPSGATIFLNNKNMGIQTPDTLTWLKTQVYSIRLSLPLYADTTFHADAVDGSVSEYFVKFKINTRLYCTSMPTGAEIFLNDSATSKNTPVTFTGLVPGNHKVKASFPEHRSDSIVAVVRGGITTTVNFTLEDTSKWVSYNTSNSGLKDNYVTSMAFDNSNVLWAGTYFGLHSFDGKNWKQFTTSNSILKTNVIYCVVSDKENRIWIGTADGLYLYDNGQFYDRSHILPDPSVKTILIEDSGIIWIGTFNGLVKYYNGNYEIFNTSNSGLKDNLITCLELDKQNRLWIGSLYKGISVFDGKSWTYYDNTNINVNANAGLLNAIESITVDKNGIIWVSHIRAISATGMITYFDGDKWNIFSNPELGNKMTFVLHSWQDNVFLGTINGLGLYNLSSSSFNFYARGNQEFPYLRIESFSVNRNGDLFFGTSGFGLGKLKRGNF